MSTVTLVSIIVIIAVGALVALYLVRRMQADQKIQGAEHQIQKDIQRAKKDANQIISKAHSEAQSIVAKSRVDAEEEVKRRRQSISDIEKRVLEKEQYMDTREEKLNEKENLLNDEFEKVKRLKKKQDDLIQELLNNLEKTAGFSKEEAKKILLTNVEREVRSSAGQMIKDIEDQAKKIANRKAKEIVTNSIQRIGVDLIAPATTSVVQLPDDEMKGRVIGKEGRNIRAFEATTGVDVIIDDTPGAVVLSAFDPIRRETAKIALGKLVQDGRIHPTRIEEAVEKAREELDDVIKEHGERAAEKIGQQFHPKILEYLGRLHYRTSYGQNQLSHALEAAIIASNMAEELGVNAQLAARGALLHDIGKALDFEVGGSHDDLGKEICEKYGESQEVINCIMAHHEDEEPDTIEAIIVMMADAISSVRPGARRESMDTYIKRLEKLEGIANSYEGVDKAYAIQAGREIRVVVRPDEVDDPGSHKLAHDIAKQIESEMDYPGEIKVSIIRETRAAAIAH